MEFLALLSVAGLVLCVGMACSVFGLTVCRLFGWRWILRKGLGLNAVVGLAVTFLFLEVWNFFSPINHASIWVLAFFVGGPAVLLRRTIIRAFRDFIRSSGSVVGVSLLLLLLTVSWFGLGPSEHGHFDTGLYYLTSIRWAREYPVVPGLANLHSRLGYNQSLFLFIAFLSNLMNLGLARACQIVNPIVVFVSGWAILEGLKLNLAEPKARRVRTYKILLICALFFLASHMWISAPTSDIAAAALALPGALALFCFLEDIFDRNTWEASNWLFVLTIVAGTLIKLKLSYLVLGGAAVIIAAFAILFIQRREFYRAWIRVGILASVLVIPWATRGLVLTGYAFYPSTFIRLRTDWALSRKEANKERDWIYSWARWPNKEPKDVLHSDAWFAPWVERNAQHPENIFLFEFVIGGLVSILLSFCIPMDRERRLRTVLLALPSALALVFWFKTAPEPRFGYASVLLFGINGFYAAGSALSGLSIIRAALYTSLVTITSVWLIFGNEWPLISLYQKKFPQGFPKSELVYRTTESGLRVGVPVAQQAWDSGLLVTPYFNPWLILRGRGLRDGFRIKQPVFSPNQRTN